MTAKLTQTGETQKSTRRTRWGTETYGKVLYGAELMSSETNRLYRAEVIGTIGAPE